MLMRLWHISGNYLSKSPHPVESNLPYKNPLPTLSQYKSNASYSKMKENFIYTKKNLPIHCRCTFRPSIITVHSSVDVFCLFTSFYFGLAYTYIPTIYLYISWIVDGFLLPKVLFTVSVCAVICLHPPLPSSRFQ
jgi:hypothetical protein